MAILIVDDSNFSRSVTEAILSLNGYHNTVPVESARQAFAYLRLDDEPECKPDIDLIVMDIIMPEIDGIEACRIIKANAHYKDVPVIMITANTGIERLEQAFAAGAMDYITKPLHEIELLARVRSALKLKKEIDERKSHEQQLLHLMRQLEQANEQFKRLCSIDGLTGIPNRRHFDEMLNKEWRRAKRNEHPLSVILLDIDCFKSYNDTYGHLSGDDCLKQVAQAINQVLARAGDLVARYGGEEFVTVLPSTDKPGGLFMAEKIRCSIESLKIPHVGSVSNGILTASLGVATLATDNRDMLPNPEALLRMADEALYRAKKAGRNRVYCC